MSNVPALKDLQKQVGGVELSSLIAAPFLSAVNTQKQICQTSLEFLKDYTGYDNKSAPTVKMNLGGSKFTVPALALVDIPTLSIESMDTSFSYESKSSYSSSSSTTKRKKTSALSVAGVGFFSLTLKRTNTDVTTKEENRRKSDSSAKTQIRIHAKDYGPTEGMSLLVNNLTRAIPSTLPSTQTSQ
eukprot:TRINITY_DN14023_c0_g1_i1.p1 TRINITY_DN14023_c0_g1~~TRINITY_DN14023_c0_g1_i1.p1  ORF type:complete len:195 (-),score=38.15 TRINITY_DN14023_c0_g1_i1:113-670(-)